MKRTILITGATDGIGKATAMALAQQGHRVIVHGRNREKAQRVVAEIRTATGNQQVTFLIADLFSLRAVQQLAEQFLAHYDHLDVLINNAGAVLNNHRAVSVDGVEKTMALNVLAPFLLTQLLLPSLEKSSDGRIINMSSASHRASGRPDLNDLNLGKDNSAQRRYSLSKLFVIWNTQHQVKLLKQQGVQNVTVNASHPGAIATNFGQDSDKGWLVNLVYKVAIKLASFGPLRTMATPEHGAATNIYLATSENVDGISGLFWGDAKPQKPSTRYYSAVAEQQVWDYCQAVVRPFLSDAKH